MDSPSSQTWSPRGRGTGSAAPNRFERLHLELDVIEENQPHAVPTEFLVDDSRTVLAKNDSPDIGFQYSLNPYRGCEHGCIYCYARPTHEYLGFSAGLDFETRILVKKDAPHLLEGAFQRPTWNPQVVALSGNTDCYQPVERRLQLTRRCLEVFLAYRNPVAIITKNELVTRDLDILAELAALDLVHVSLSITSMDAELTGVMEPRTSRPRRRLRAIESLAARNIPVGVTVAPLIPGLNDQAIPEILAAAAAAGARWASYAMIRLPGAVEPLFVEWLQRHLPSQASKIEARLRSVRGGSKNRFFSRMRGEGRFAALVADLFALSRRRHGLTHRSGHDLSTAHFRSAPGQLRLDLLPSWRAEPRSLGTATKLADDVELGLGDRLNR